MKRLDIRNITRAILESVKRHELPEPGSYCRWLWQDESGSRELGINEYGCADAANILYTLNEFRCDEKTRKARINALLSMQDRESGMFHEKTHHTIHTTAHCAAALELFDVKPLYPMKELHKYTDRKALFEFLDSLNWNSPWTESHQGAGIYAALANSSEITKEFEDNYFEWLWENTDPVTGFWKKGYADRAQFSSDRYPDGKNAPESVFSYMAGGFHYIFNHEYAKMPLRYPEKIIDSCIDMYKNGGIRKSFMREIDFLEVDWIYCLNRASRQTPHRHAEVKELLYEAASVLTEYLNSIDCEKDDRFNDLHLLFGTTCALAELQAALPGTIITDKPLRLVLDRRPFI
ncbi:MAG: hypothetical protein E7617_01350 [Ruminococcaceae bacterium]|nr:hypothetical protein [Oscillospiraceae bacterium]